MSLFFSFELYNFDKKIFMIQAIKNQGTPKEQVKVFSEEAWRFMGKNKNGWVKLSDSIATNTITKSEKPETGEKGKVTKQVVSNTVTKSETVEVKDEISEYLNEKKSFFLTIKENLTKNAIKNFLDSDEVNIPYKANSIDELSDILFSHFEGDIAKLKTAFKID